MPSSDVHIRIVSFFAILDITRKKLQAKIEPKKNQKH